MSSEMSKSPKKPGQNVAGQEEVPSSALDGNDVLGFDIVRRPRSSRDAMKDMDTAETIVLLQEPRGKDTSSDDELGVDYSGIESAADNTDEVLSHSDAIDNSDMVQKDNQKLDESLEFADAMAVINLMNLKPERNSASGDLYGGTDKCANEALLAEESELTRNDDSQGLVDCPENSALMELKWPNLDLRVSDKSENPAFDDAQGGINDVLGKQTSLTEPMAREADQEPEQKLDSLEEQAAKGITSVDEPGTDIPCEESGSVYSDEVLTSFSGESSCSVESSRGNEITSDMEEDAAHAMLMLRYDFGRTVKSGNEAPVLEEVDRSCNHIRQAPMLDQEVLDNSVVMQKEEQKVDLSAPAPSDSSEEERSDMIDGQENQTT